MLCLPVASSLFSGWLAKWFCVGIPKFSTATSTEKPAGVALPGVEALTAARRPSSVTPGVEALANEPPCDADGSAVGGGMAKNLGATGQAHARVGSLEPRCHAEPPINNGVAWHTISHSLSPRIA